MATSDSEQPASTVRLELSPGKHVLPEHVSKPASDTQKTSPKAEKTRTVRLRIGPDGDIEAYEACDEKNSNRILRAIPFPPTEL